MVKRTLVDADDLDWTVVSPPTLTAHHDWALNDPVSNTAAWPAGRETIYFPSYGTVLDCPATLTAVRDPCYSNANLMSTPINPPTFSPAPVAGIGALYASIVHIEGELAEVYVDIWDEPSARLSAAQLHWLSERHRTLIQLQFEFLMATTQHPSTLSEWCNWLSQHRMPQRMANAGIMSYLQLFPRCSSGSEAHVSAFHHFAYGILEMLLYKVPTFGNQWKRCLADVACCAFSLEPAKVLKEEWRTAAMHWCGQFNLRKPGIGRYLDCLAWLESSSLQKFCLYVRSMTCVTPSQSTHMLDAFCGDLLQGYVEVEKPLRQIVQFHALQRFGQSSSQAKKEAARALKRLSPARIATLGVSLIIMNVGALLRNSDCNQRTFSGEVFDAQNSTSFQISLAQEFHGDTIKKILRQKQSVKCTLALLPSVHALLVFTLGVTWSPAASVSRQNARAFQSPPPPLSYLALPEHARPRLCGFLNALMRLHPNIADGRDYWTTIRAYAQQTNPSLPPTFSQNGPQLHSTHGANTSSPPFPLAEDEPLIGLTWAQPYYALVGYPTRVGDSPFQEVEHSAHRVNRVMFLAWVLASKTNLLTFNESSASFRVSDVDQEMLRSTAGDGLAR